jgi:hypothetical protein
MADLFKKNEIKDPNNKLKKFASAELNQLPAHNKKVATELERRKKVKVDLPYIQKEEMTLVQKILQEMGCGCDMKKHKTPEEIADKHGKSVKYINKQLKAGIQVEHEHTDDQHEAEVIALQHLAERPDYYERLKKVEKVDEAKKEGDPCWKGYEQVGMKKKGGKKVPNCVPVSEAFRLPAQNGQLMHILHSWRGKMMSTQLFFPAGRVPSRSEVAEAINKVYPDSRLLSYRAGDFAPDQPLVQVGNSKSKNYLMNNGTIGESAAWTRKEGKNQEGGLNEKGRKSYEKENPGSDLKPPVSAEQAKKSPKSAARRKSFCSRMSGIEGPMKDEKGRPTRKALSLRKWDC